MFGFGKKEDKTPEKLLAELQRKKDWAGVSKTYYEMGVTAMDAGDLHKAQLWLHRADTIYSADDNIYDKVGEKLMDDCSDRIGRLEDEDGLFYNAVPAEIEARAEELSDPQVRVWGLLSMARLVRLGERLARLPGCEVLGQLDWAVDLMFRSLQILPSQEAYQRLMDMCNALYELNGKPIYYSGEIEVPGRPPFQLFDLNGLFGVEQELKQLYRQPSAIAGRSESGRGGAAPGREQYCGPCPTSRLLHPLRRRQAGGCPSNQGGAPAYLERL